MIRGFVQEAPAQFRLPCRIGCIISLAFVIALAGCGSHHTQHARAHYNPSRYYPPPGSRSDPWGPYIREASARFGVPELWVRRVMRQESDGQEDVISWAGAMGLMQVMPDTYEDLRERYSLGDDPFDPHNNILAGTAYLREMYDRFGAPGFLAAYNAGPNRLDSYLSSGRPLPEETVNYVAAIAPQLGPDTPMSGPLAVYAGPVTRMAARATPVGCDVDAAYNPNNPCKPLQPTVVAQPAIIAVASPVSTGSYGQRVCNPDDAYDPTRPCPRTAPAPAIAYSPSIQPTGRCDPDAAFDPAHPCQPLVAASTAIFAQPLPTPPTPRQPEYQSMARPIQEGMRQPPAFAAEPPTGQWAVQVGAFANLATAQAAAEKARTILPDILRTAKIELPATTPFGTQVAFRARLFGLSPTAAADACLRLSARGLPCLPVPPADNAL